MPRLHPFLWLLAVALAASAAACGSAPEPPSVPEPAASPAPTRPATGRVVRVGNAPEGVAVDGETGIVALGFRNPDRLALVDARSGRVRRQVRLPSSPRHLQLAAPGGPVLVPTEDGNSLVRVELPSGRIAGVTPVGKEPHDAAAAAGRIFVGNELEDTVSAIENGQVIAKLKAPIQPGGLAGTATTVGVVGVRGRTFEVFDAGSLRSLGSTGAGVGPTHMVAEPEGCFYVADTQGDAVLIIRRHGGKLEQTRRINVPGTPYGIALDQRRRVLWVTQTARNTIAEFSISGSRPRLLRTLPTVRQPNTVGVDPDSGRAYVAGRGGLLQIIEPGDDAPPTAPDEARARCG